MPGPTPEQARQILAQRAAARVGAAGPSPERAAEILAARRASGEAGAPPIAAAPPIEDRGALSALARGAGQGVTLGFGDELGGAVGALWAKAKGDPDTFAALYEQFRDLDREENKASEEQHPVANMAGQIGGGIVSLAIPGVGAAGKIGQAGAAAAKTAGAATAARIGGAAAGGAILGAAEGAGRSEADSIGGLAADAAIGGTVGGVAGGIIGATPSVISRVLPGATSRARAVEQVTGGKTPSALAPEIREGLRLEREMGERLTAPQITMEPFALGTQTTLARSASPVATSTLRDVSEKQQAALLKHLGASIDMLGGTREAAQASERISTSYNRYVEGFQSRISDAVRPMFEAAIRTGARLPTGRITTALDDLIASNSTELSTETGKTAVKSLVALRQNLGDTIDIGSIQNALRQWGKAVRGSGLAIADTGDKAFERGVARKVFGAINKTLSDGASSPDINGEAASALRAARAKYAELMAEQGANDSEVLRRIVRQTAKLGGDTSVERILTSEASATQIGRAVSVLDRADPLAARDFRTAALGAFLEKLDTPAKLVTALEKPAVQRKINALIGGGQNGAKVLARLSDAAAYARRISSQGTASGKSPTEPLRATMAAIRQVPVLGALSDEVVRVLAPLSDPGKLTAALVNPDARAMLLGITSPGVSDGMVRKLGPRFLAAVAVEQDLFGGQQEGATE